MTKPHPSIACPECDDVSNECCQLCRGTDQHCPVCECPADECEYQEGMGDDDDDHLWESYDADEDIQNQLDREQDEEMA